MGARALLAFQRGDDTDEAFTGALMWAEFQAYEVAFVRAHRKDETPDYTPRRGRRRRR